MFCQVSRSIQAVVLNSIQVAKHFIARIKTTLGLHVVSEIARRMYLQGIKVGQAYLDNNPIQFSTAYCQNSTTQH